MDNKKEKELDIYELSEEDFYPPADDRVLKSGVSNIVNGDNFVDYSEYIFDMTEELYEN